MHAVSLCACSERAVCVHPCMHRSGSVHMRSWYLAVTVVSDLRSPPHKPSSLSMNWKQERM